MAKPGAKSPSLFRKSQPPPSPKRPLRIKDIREAISALSPEPAEPRQRKSGLMARDARVYGGETKDFVDWIRTTGPTSEQQVQPIILSHRLSNPNSLNSFKAKSNLVPRDADVRSNTSGDLIDFIRRGPPTAANGVESRAPKKVNNYRSTMDSDDIGNLANGVGGHSLASRPSETDSFNSGTPLLGKNKPLPPSVGSNTLAPPSNGPARTRRRPRDPYAIESDDEDEFTALPDRTNFSKGGTQVENMQEFLRSSSPSVLHGNSQSNDSNSRNGANGVARSQSERNRATQAGGMNGNAPTSASNRSSQPAMSISSRFLSKREARPAGATKTFNGHGYYYSTNDMADFLRTSGPDAPTNNANRTSLTGGSVGNTSLEVDRQGSKRGLAFWKRGVEAGA
jgi:hypothetical protein